MSVIEEYRKACIKNRVNQLLSSLLDSVVFVYVIGCLLWSDFIWMTQKIPV